MRALISGGCGFLGSHLVEKLLDEGHEVTIVDDLSTGTDRNIAQVREKVKLRVHDAGSIELMRKLVEDCDIMFALAAPVGVEKVMADPANTIRQMHNCTQTAVLLCSMCQRRLIQVSSSEVYGNRTDVPFTEDMDLHIGPPSHSRWCYAAGKLMDEFMCLAHFKKTALPVTVVRLFNSIGPRQTGKYGMVVPRFVRQALAGEPLSIYGDGEQARCFSSVHDVVKCLYLLAISDPKPLAGEIYNVGNNKETTIDYLATMVIHAVHGGVLHRAEPPKLIPYKEIYGEDFTDMRRRVPDCTKLEKAIGYKPDTPLAEILREIVEYERKR